jgi:hypothetical protein
VSSEIKLMKRLLIIPMTTWFRKPVPTFRDRHAEDMIAPTAPRRKGRPINTSGAGRIGRVAGKGRVTGSLRCIILLPHFRQPPAVPI